MTPTTQPDPQSIWWITFHFIDCRVWSRAEPHVGGKEETTPVPEDSHGIAKLAVEQELRVSHEMFGLDYIIFRPHNVYQPATFEHRCPA